LCDAGGRGVADGAVRLEVGFALDGIAARRIVRDSPACHSETRETKNVQEQDLGKWFHREHGSFVLSRPRRGVDNKGSGAAARNG
jgi:hypothetical protein